MNLPDPKDLTPDQLKKQLAILQLEGASVELSLAASCLRVNATPQLIQYVTQATAKLEAAKKVIFGETPDEVD